MNHTTNLHLPQWEETDRIMMDDFNDAMSKIDAAVAQIEFGTYTGNGTYPRTISLGGKPKAVILFSSFGHANANGSIFGGLFGPGKVLGNTSMPNARVTDAGFELLRDTTNRSGDIYYYLAVL